MLLAVMGGAISSGAQAADANAGRNLAATCAICHGTDGRSEARFASLAGKKQDRLVTKMKEFKAGEGAPTIMHQIAKGFSDEQIDLIAAYFAAQSR